MKNPIIEIKLTASDVVRVLAATQEKLVSKRF